MLAHKIFKNRIFIISFSIVVLAALIGGSFYFGYREGKKEPQTYVIRGVNNLDRGKPEDVDFGLFWEAWRVLKEKDIDADKVNDQDLVYSAISGLFGAFKDPNTVFLPPSDAKKFGEDISGEFSGIGAEINIRDNQLVVITPLKNTPADKAGLKAGDKILKINDIQTAGLTVEEAIKLIRGEKGTTVTLEIFREGWEKPRAIPIVRNTIQIPTLDWEMRALGDAEGKDKGIAYIQLYNFYEKAPFLFYQAAVELVAHNPRGIILDLRNNPGGYLDAAVNIAGWFLKPGEVVVSEEFRSAPKEIFKAGGAGIFKDTPTVILINEGSASASEILAGALRDDRGTKLVGKKSFGKGTVQELVTVKDNALAKITVAHWRMPKGQLIEKNGLTPDYEVALEEEDAKAGRDPQFEKAMEILKSEISASESPGLFPLFRIQNIEFETVPSL